MHWPVEEILAALFPGLSDGKRAELSDFMTERWRVLSAELSELREQENHDREVRQADYKRSGRTSGLTAEETQVCRDRNKFYRDARFAAQSEARSEFVLLSGTFPDDQGLASFFERVHAEVTGQADVWEDAIEAIVVAYRCGASDASIISWAGALVRLMSKKNKIPDMMQELFEITRRHGRLRRAASGESAFGTRAPTKLP